jgi:hypothetical protein
VVRHQALFASGSRAPRRLILGFPVFYDAADYTEFSWISAPETTSVPA